MVEITGGSGGGLETSFTVLLNSSELKISKPLGETFKIKFNYSSVYKEDETINDGPGSGVILVSDVQRGTCAVKQGENEIDITNYLSVGANTVKLVVTNSEGTSRRLQFTINVLSLTINTSFPKLKAQPSGLLPISYTVTSESAFTSHFVITKQNALPGEEYYEPTQIFSDSFNRGTTATAYLDPLPSGAYSLDIYAKSGDITSNIITIGLIFYLSSDISPFIVMLPDRTTFKQGEIVSIPYLIYHPNITTPSITFSIYSINAETNVK
jgi:hypothetical protein